MNNAEQLRYIVLAAQREGARLLAAKFADLDITVSQAEALRVIGGSQPMSIKQLGEKLICEGGNPSRLVSTLVKKGLIKTESATKDRREVALVLTTVGSQLNERVQRAEQEFYDEVNQRSSSARDFKEQLLLLLEGTRSAEALRLRGILDDKDGNREIY